MLETWDYMLSLLAVHKPFYISICISTLPTQFTPFISLLKFKTSSDKGKPPKKKAKRNNIRWDVIYANKICFRFIDKLLSTFPRFLEWNRHITVTRDIPLYRHHVNLDPFCILSLFAAILRMKYLVFKCIIWNYKARSQGGSVGATDPPPFCQRCPLRCPLRS